MTKRRAFAPWLVVCFVAAGAVMIGIGISRGEMRIVDAKAIRICLECIGIG